MKLTQFLLELGANMENVFVPTIAILSVIIIYLIAYIIRLRRNAHPIAEQLAAEFFEKWKVTELELLKKQKDLEVDKMKWEEKQQYMHKQAQWELTQKEEVIRKSKSIRFGKVYETFAPYFKDKGLDFDPQDARFLGSPIDLMVFLGLTQGKMQKLVFLEIKTKKSTLNERQRMIEEFVKAAQARGERSLEFITAKLSDHI